MTYLRPQMPEFNDEQLDQEIDRATLDVEIATHYMLHLQDERWARWYMRHVIIEPLE
jgi:hypothetical protein